MNFSTVNYIFGPPRSGKTTLLAKLSRQFLKQGRVVYANFHLKDCIEIQDEDLGYFDFGENSVILLDECGISYNNRDAFSNKSLMKDKKRLDFWKKAGHFKGTQIFVASQGWNDVDLKIRTLATSYFFIRKWIFGFTVVKPVFKDGGIDENTHEPTDFYTFDVFLRWKLLLRCRYYKFFDSYEHDVLPPYPIRQPQTITKQGQRYLDKWNSKRSKRSNSLHIKKRSEGMLKRVFHAFKYRISSNDDILT